MTTLYELTAQYRSDLERLSELDLDEQTVADTLDSLGGELQTKAINVAMFASNLDATASAIKKAETQMATRRKAIEARSARLRKYLLDNMQACSLQKIECPQFVLSVRSNPASVEVFDERMVPGCYTRIQPAPPPVPDKAAIKRAIDTGVEVPGCRLTKTQRLEIK
jgi:hypothetical protein